MPFLCPGLKKFTEKSGMLLSYFAYYPKYGMKAVTMPFYEHKEVFHEDTAEHGCAEFLYTKSVWR